MKKTEVNLRCEYTDAELAEKRDELSNVVIGAQEVEKRKADAAKDFKENLDALYSRSNILAFQIKSRGENRAVECVIELNKPTNGLKTTVRLDTGELVTTEPMTDEERQDKLFESLERDFHNPPPETA